MAKKFTIMISRTCYENFVVEADTKDEAIEKAYAKATNTNWGSSEPDYAIGDVYEGE